MARFGKDFRKVIAADYYRNLRGLVEGAVRIGESLCNANIRGGQLFLAYLRGADLRGANLISANLENAKLEGADLRGTDLSQAGLFGADLRGAYCAGADFCNARIDRDTKLEGMIIDDGEGNEYVLR